jgi:hypothetical protein
MLKKYANRWAYGFAAIIFFIVAVINGWMIVSSGFTTFRIVAAIAFAVGGLLLLVAFRRTRRPIS